MGSLERYCRLCALVFRPDELLKLFGGGRGGQQQPDAPPTSAAIKLRSLLSVDLSPTDRLPKQICHSCSQTIDYCCTFVEKCRKIESELQSGMDISYVQQSFYSGPVSSAYDAMANFFTPTTTAAISEATMDRHATSSVHDGASSSERLCGGGGGGGEESEGHTLTELEPVRAAGESAGYASQAGGGGGGGSARRPPPLLGAADDAHAHAQQSKTVLYREDDGDVDNMVVEVEPHDLFSPIADADRRTAAKSVDADASKGAPNAAATFAHWKTQSSRASDGSAAASLARHPLTSDDSAAAAASETKPPLRTQELDTNETGVSEAASSSSKRLPRMILPKMLEAGAVGAARKVAVAAPAALVPSAMVPAAPSAATASVPTSSHAPTAAAAGAAVTTPAMLNIKAVNQTQIMIPITLRTPCKTCGVVIEASNVHDLRSHICAAKMRNVHCTWTGCRKKFFTKTTLKYHLKHYHGAHGLHLKPPRKQPLIDAPTMSLAPPTLAGKFMCQYEGCVKSYNSKNYLVEHERQHTGERPFSCRVCEKAFYRILDLKKHQLLKVCQ